VRQTHAPGDLGDRLARRTLELVDIPSPSREETRIADHVAAGLDALGVSGRVVRHGNSVLTLPSGNRERVLFVGHLDTVPAQGNMPGRLEGGMVHGLGAADMKGSLAVLIELAAWLTAAGADTSLDAGFLFYDKEEIPVRESGLTPLFTAHPEAFEASLAVVMEPTGGEIQMGCLGNIQADAVFRGKSSHSARPWLGENAVHKGITALGELSSLDPVDDEIDGLLYREVCSVTRIEGGIAANVIPDEMRVHVNFRYSPRRGETEAEARLAELVPGDEVVIASNAPAARPCGDNALLRRLRDVSTADVTPKQAWTDVAQFASRDIDAVNYGPGDPHLAHTREEAVGVDALVAAFDVLTRFLV
jgi:succinyl-diaminopimelate desuccinylase